MTFGIRSMKLKKKDIEQYIPQRQPFIMISRLLNADANESATELEIEPGNIFIEDGKLMEAGLAENMAQTAAAHVGYMMMKAGLPVPVGFIAALKNLEVLRLPNVGSTIKTTINVVNQVFDFTIAEAKIEMGNNLLAKAQLRIYLKP